jgi:hypothetical protein
VTGSAAEFLCQSATDRMNSAAGGFGQIVAQAADIHWFSVLKGRFWRLEGVFPLPAGESPRAHPVVSIADRRYPEIRQKC